jgi:hypothetical protein
LFSENLIEPAGKKIQIPPPDALLKSYIARISSSTQSYKEEYPQPFARVKLSIIIDMELSELGIWISFSIVKSHIEPYIFCHPSVLKQDTDLLEYYRNLAALSQKGLSQILSGRLPKSHKGDSREKYRVIVRILNQIISSVVVDAKGFSLSLAQNTILSEIGAEIQGTWVNMIGQGAKAVEGMS